MMSKRLVSIGEAMIELSHLAQDSWTQGFAGDSLNTAWAAKALLPDAWQVDYVTRIGRDGFSDRFMGFLEQSEIGTGHIQRCDDRIMGMYAIETDAHGERSFTYWRSSSAAREMADDTTALADALKSASMVYVSGISMAILSAPARARMMQVLGARNARPFTLVYDANARPKLWESQAAMRQNVTDMAEISDIVLPTFDDEVLAFGDATPADTATRYLSCGVPTIVVKNGTAPTTLLHDGEMQEIPVLDPVSPTDTTGAGDSFNGAFMAAIASGQSLFESVRQAQFASAEVVQHKGALVQPSLLQSACQSGSTK